MVHEEKDQASQTEDSLLSELIRDEEQLSFEGVQDSNTGEQTGEEEEGEAQALETQGQAEEEDSKEDNKEGEEEGQQAPQGITEEFAREFGLPREMVGKPFSELGKSFKNLTAELTRKSQKLSELGNPKQKRAPGEQEGEREIPVSEYIQASLKKLPDPLLDFQGYQTALGQVLANVYEKAQTSAEQKVLEKLGPQIQPAREMAQKQMEREIVQRIQDGLPEGAEVKDIIEAFKESQKDFMPLMIPVYSKNPQKLIQDVLMFYRSQEGDFAPQPKKKAKAVNAEETLEVNSRAIKKTQAALEESNRKRPSDLNSQTREAPKKPGRLLDELIEDEERYFNSY